MKSHLDIVHEGTASGEKTRMFFDAAASAHLMRVLTDLYSDPALAVIREYSTNALDSHVAAGISDPIEISLPNDMAATFVVKDHGLGLSKEDVTERYVAYGYSSKRDTDEQTGMLGLGCKSGLTYSSSFTVKAIKDGRKVLVMVTRDADGCGAVQIMDECDTLDPNGVEVSIPVKNVMLFNRKAKDFYRFWSPGTVLINGKAPASIFDAQSEYKPSLLDEDVAIVGTNVLSSDYVVMGNVPYPVDSGQATFGVSKRDRYGSYMGRQSYAVVRVPIGDLDFTPNREALHYTKLTKSTLDTVASWIIDVQVQTAQSEVAAAKDRAEALVLAKSWRDKGVKGNFIYKNEDVPTQFPLPGHPVKWLGGSYPASSQGVAGFIQTETAMRTLHVTGFKATRLDPTTKAKITKWVDDNPDVINRRSRVGYLPANTLPPVGEFDAIICYSHQIHESWLPEVLVVDISEIRAVDLGKAAPIRRKQPKFRVLTAYGDTLDLDNLDDHTTEQIVVLDSTVRSPQYRRALGTYANGYGAVVCLVSPSKRPAFFRNNPTAMSDAAFLKREARAMVKGCKPYDALVYRHGVEGREIDGLSGVDPTTVADPFVVDLLMDAQNPAKSTWDDARYDAVKSAVSEFQRNVGNLTANLKLPAFTDAWETKAKVVTDTYPHLRVDRQYGFAFGPPEKVEILNALYYARTNPPVVSSIQPTNYPNPNH